MDRTFGSNGFLQARVSATVHDNLGFMWFGTQYGLNRFDGYRKKVLKHERGNSTSLNCVYIQSLFIDKFDPITETFTHSLIEKQVNGRLPAAIMQMSEDRHTEGYGWQRREDSIRLDPPQVKPPDMLTIPRSPRASPEMM